MITYRFALLHRLRKHLERADQEEGLPGEKIRGVFPVVPGELVHGGTGGSVVGVIGIGSWRRMSAHLGAHSCVAKIGEVGQEGVGCRWVGGDGKTSGHEDWRFGVERGY